MSYEELPHTADVRIRARAATLGDLFSDMTDALMQVMYGDDRTGSLKQEIRVRGGNPESLLRDYLSEVLYVSEVTGTVFSHAAVTMQDNALHAVLSGEPFDPARHSGGTEVKGISYSGLLVRKEGNGYMAEIVFDV